MSKPPPKLKTSTGGVKVAVRVRPFNSREKDISKESGQPLKCIVSMEGKKCIVLDKENEYEPDDKYPAFCFDCCFWSMPADSDNDLSPNGFADQQIVYEQCGKESLTNAWEGYNTCIFAYGQTGSGKSFSMLGAPGLPGISPRIITDLFAHVDEQSRVNEKMTFKIETAFFEIYMEKVKDLFAEDKNAEYAAVKIRQHPLYGIQVQGLVTKSVTTEKECAKEMDYGVSQRSLASTKMNATSSRSHAIFQIHISTNDVVTKTKTTATINLVDLAGSERLGKTGASGQTKEEGMAINLSLSTLRKVMDALVDQGKGKSNVPPYRESMLTWVLKESLGGNSKTIMITAISPHYDNLEDTISTLRYGLKAKAIINKAVKQETSANKQYADLQGTIAELEAQLAAARDSGGSVSNEQLEAMQKEREMLKEAEHAVHKELEDMNSRASQLETQLKDAKKRAFANAFKGAFGLQTRAKKLEETETKVKDLTAAKQEVEHAVTQLSSEKKQLTQEVERQKHELDQFIEALDNERREREEEGRKAKEDRAEAEESIRDEYDAELRNQNEKHKSELEEQRKSMADELVQQRTQLERQSAEEREHHHAQVDTFKSQLAQKEETNLILQKRVHELEPLIAEVAQLKQAVENLQQHEQVARDEMRVHQDQARRLQQMYEERAKQHDADLERLRFRCEELRRSDDEARHERDELKKTCLTLEMLHSADSRIIGAMSSGQSGTETAPEPRPTSPSRGHLPVSGVGVGYGIGNSHGSPQRLPNSPLNTFPPAPASATVITSPGKSLGFGPSSTGAGWRDRVDARSEQRIARLVSAAAAAASPHRHGGTTGRGESPRRGYPRSAYSPDTASLAGQRVYSGGVATAAESPLRSRLAAATGAVSSPLPLAQIRRQQQQQQQQTAALSDCGLCGSPHAGARIRAGALPDSNTAFSSAGHPSTTSNNSGLSGVARLAAELPPPRKSNGAPAGSDDCRYLGYATATT